MAQRPENKMKFEINEPRQDVKQKRGGASPSAGAQSPVSPPPAAASTIVFSIHRKWVVLLCLVALAPWLLLTVWMMTTRWRERAASVGRGRAGLDASPTARVMRGQPGPWGNLEYVRIAIEPPEEFISPSVEEVRPQWFFEGYTPDQLKGLLAGCSLTTAQQRVLLDPGGWTQREGGILLSPDVETVLSLDADSRRTIYLHLARSLRNPLQQNAFVFRASQLDERIEGSGLTTESIRLFKSLLYSQGDLLLFADLPLVLPRLPDDHERLRFVKTLARRNTLLMRLQVTPETDLEQLINYWGSDGRAKDIRPLLESLRRIPGGVSLDVAHLLPPFARRRLYTFPTPELAAVRAGGSHWTALNFFSREPDDRFNDDAVVAQTILRHYYVIYSGMRLGDLVALETPDGAIIHTAAYVADYIVFTRNGTLPTYPWQLMRVADLVETFKPRLGPNTELEVRYFRLREHGGPVLGEP